jgi:predicted small lipoprotein YifL
MMNMHMQGSLVRRCRGASARGGPTLPLALALVLSWTLLGCGQKGPLVLPKEKTGTAPAASAASR